MPNWEAIRADYETSQKSFGELAIDHNANISTIKSRKQREKWQRLSPTDAKYAKVASVAQPDEGEFNYEGRSNLTEKQQLFCRYYIKSFNGTMAAKKAGYSSASAHVQASVLLTNPKVREEITRLKGEIQKELMVGPMDIVALYMKIAFADITEYVKFGKRIEKKINQNTGEPDRYRNGKQRTVEYNYVEFEDWDKVDGTVISEVKQGKDGISVKLSDRMAALKFLTDYFDMVPDAYKDKVLELKREELEIRKQESEARHGEPEKPDISDYVEALRGNIEDVFADEED